MNLWHMLMGVHYVCFLYLCLRICVLYVIHVDNACKCCVLLPVWPDCVEGLYALHYRVCYALIL